MPDPTEINNAAFTRNAFFSNPKKTSAAVFGISMLGLITAQCIILIPLGARRNSAYDQLETASNDFIKSAGVLATILQQVKEANQRVADLDCAMGGEFQFNKAVYTLFDNLTLDKSSAMDRLKLYWQLIFKPDTTDMDNFSERKSWEDFWIDADGNTVYSTYYYNEETTITNLHNNIVELWGNTLPVSPLNCGVYARSIQLKPMTVKTGGTPTLTTGSKTSGKVYVSYNQNYGSNIQVLQTLEGQTNIHLIEVSRTTPQAVAANNLAMELYRLLAGFVMVLNASHVNYSELQKTIRESLPVLESTIPAANNTLLQKADETNLRQAVLNSASDEFNTALAIWLPMLVVPILLAVITCLTLKFGKSRCVPEEQKETELRPS